MPDPTTSDQAASNPTAAIADVLHAYFDGLYTSDVTILARVFHPLAIYATATAGELLHHTMDVYFPIVAAREAPAARAEVRRDAILAIDVVGPDAAFAKVECAIGDRFFTDLLTMVHVEGRWQIIAKVFHYEIDLAHTPDSPRRRPPRCPTST
jgi:hypothetical protein